MFVINCLACNVAGWLKTGRPPPVRHLQEPSMSDHSPPAAPGWNTHPPGMRELAQMLEATWGDRLRLPRETFGLDGMPLGDTGTVSEKVALEAPFGRLLRFGVTGKDRTRVLLVAPMAGH